MSLAFVFPGQGSQSVGMLAELADSFPLVKSLYQEASGILGFDLWEMVQAGPAESLNRTENTQPALLTAGVAIWRIWREQDGEVPSVLAGHSLGEYTALVCAGALEFSDAVALVHERGKAMQEAVPEGSGAMAAILGLDDSQVIEICKNITNRGVVSAANFNSLGQVVIAGDVAAVEAAMAAAKDAGAKRAILIPVSVPSHCALMAPAADKLAERLQSLDLKEAEIPIIQNVDVALRRDGAGIQAALIQQLHQPVRWVETINKIQSLGVTRVIECGPGKVLTGLIKRIDRTLETQAVYDPPSLDAALALEVS